VRNREERNALIQIFGNTKGLKASQVQQIERLYRRRIAADQLITQDLARELTEISFSIKRQVGVLLDRRGSVTHAMVGGPNSIEMPEWGRMRAGGGRLRGLRCVHTHFGKDHLTRDDLTDLAVLRLDAMVTLSMDSKGHPDLAYAAALKPANAEGASVQEFDPQPPSQLTWDFTQWIRELESELSRTVQKSTRGAKDRAILVSVTAGRPDDDREYALAELKELARAASVDIVSVLSQHRGKADPKTVIGSGKLQDLLIQTFQHDVDLVIFDQNLSATQARNLAERMEVRVIDRTQLILDIFAQRATSRDGKLQVELAQLKYILPRLAQRDDSLSRLAGGIGGRGPGETKLEVNRRRVRDRITRLEKQLKKLRKGRQERRRRRSGLPILSIVGYTNAGKSTLLRALTQTDVFIEDKMFATLDPSSRRLRFPMERDVIITDTVGFIRDLPKDLIAAFRATLEELEEADLFLHVVDASATDLDRRLKAVHDVIDEMGLGDTPELLVFNQVDLLEPQLAKAIATRYNAIPVSALKKQGLSTLLSEVERRLFEEKEYEEATSEKTPA
jgi:GTP-binding protein HflX